MYKSRVLSVRNNIQDCEGFEGVSGVGYSLSSNKKCLVIHL